MQVAGCAAVVGATGCARDAGKAQARGHELVPPLCQTKSMGTCRAGRFIQRLCGTQTKQENTPDQKFPFRGTCKGHERFSCTQPVRTQKSNGALWLLNGQTGKFP